jgi:hypothetical protein
MSKKARRSAAAKTAKKKKARRPKSAAKSKVRARPKKTARATSKPRRKAKSNRITDKMARAFHAIVDTVEETETLRDKMEPPGVSGTS